MKTRFKVLESFPLHNLFSYCFHSIYSYKYSILYSSYSNTVSIGLFTKHILCTCTWFHVSAMSLSFNKHFTKKVF